MKKYKEISESFHYTLLFGFILYIVRGYCLIFNALLSLMCVTFALFRKTHFKYVYVVCIRKPIKLHICLCQLIQMISLWIHFCTANVFQPTSLSYPGTHSSSMLRYDFVLNMAVFCALRCALTLHNTLNVL